MLIVIGQRLSFLHLACYDWCLRFTGTTASFRQVASPCWSWMPSHYDTWVGLGFKMKWTLDLSLIKWTYLFVKPKSIIQPNNMDFIQILYEFDPIQFICLQMPLIMRTVDVDVCRSLATRLEVVMNVFSLFLDSSVCRLSKFWRRKLKSSWEMITLIYWGQPLPESSWQYSLICKRSFDLGCLSTHFWLEVFQAVENLSHDIYS